MLKRTRQKFKYLQNPTVSDYTTIDNKLYRRQLLKHISAHTGINEVVDIRKHFAYLPTKLASGKYLWLSDYYVIVRFVNILSMRAINEERFSYDEYIALKLSGEIGKTLDQKIQDARAMRNGTTSQ